VYLYRGEYERALECYQQAETILRDLGDRRGLAGDLHNIGMLYEAQGKYSEAMEQYEEALAINRSIGNRPWMANNLGNIGNVH
jgi:tetratricopeptide (TPR) repeat protein